MLLTSSAYTEIDGEKYFYMDRFVYNQEYDHLELNGAPVRDGDILELYVIGYWLRGVVRRDASGWYLVTNDQVGIRLKAGLRAQVPDIALSVMCPACIEGNLRHEKNT